jgi:hypothetical protein
MSASNASGARLAGDLGATFDIPLPPLLACCGRIRLLNGNKDAGYVYIIQDTQPLRVPELGSTKYVVMSIHFAHLGMLLDILRNQKPLQIRFYDPQSPGVAPSAFIEPTSGANTRDALALFEKLK